MENGHFGHRGAAAMFHAERAKLLVSENAMHQHPNMVEETAKEKDDKTSLAFSLNAQVRTNA